MSEPTAAEIAAMREQDSRNLPRKRRKRTRGTVTDRVTLTETDDGGVLTITPTRGHRDRVAVLVVVIMSGMIACPVIASATGAVGAVIAIAAVIGLVTLALVTSPTWHLRWTTNGDFLLYTRDPRHPRWVGRCKDLALETPATANKRRSEHVVWLRYRKRRKEKHWYPMSPGDAATFRRAGAIAKLDMSVT